MSQYLQNAVLAKHDLEEALGRLRVETSVALANGKHVNSPHLVALCRDFYRHERWVRGCGHETAARETLEMLDRYHERTMDLLTNVLTDRVLNGTMTREKMSSWSIDREVALAADLAKVRAKLAEEGMGTDPSYLND